MSAAATAWSPADPAGPNPVRRRSGSPRRTARGAAGCARAGGGGRRGGEPRAGRERRPGPPDPRRSALAPALLAPLALLWACTEPPPPAPAAGGLTIATLPAGLAFDLDGVPIPRADLDRAADAYALLHPAESQPASRRRALTNLLLPRAALAAAHPAQRQEALARALALTPPEDPVPERPDGGWPDGYTDLGPGAAEQGLEASHGVLAGHWQALGVDLWAAARGLVYPGAERGPAPLPSPWSGPLEGLGRFGWLRVLEHSPAGEPGLERYAVQVLVLPYAPELALPAAEDLLRGRRLRAADLELAEAVQARLVGLLETPAPAPEIGPPAPAPAPR